MSKPSRTDLAIKCIRAVKQVNQTHLIAAVIALLVLGGGYTMLGGSDDPGTDVDPALATNVSISENAEAGEVTFTLVNGSTVDKVLLKGDGEPAELVEAGQSHTMDGDQTVIIVAVVDGAETLIDTYEPSDDDPNEGEPGEGEPGDGGDGEGIEPAITAQPEAVAPGDTVQFDATDSIVPDGQTATYEWEFGDGETDTGATASHAYTEVGTYDVILTVSTEANGSASSTAEIFVGNEAPTARVEGRTEGTSGTTFAFSAAQSSDPNGDAISYEWDFGGEQTATGRTAEHQFSGVGEHEVTLTVTDKWGATDSITLTVTIENSPPTADADIPSSGSLGSGTSFDGSDSFDPDDDELSYRWDFGDGSSATGESPSHTYNNPGTYTVRLYVTDEHGARDVYKGLITVSGGNSGSGGGSGGGGDTSNSAPDASISGPSSGEIGETLGFDSSGSSDSDGDSLSYAWDFDDGTTTTGEIVTHEFEEAGVYDVTVTVYDSNNAADTATMSVAVTNSPPSAAATASETAVNVDTAIEFDASDSSDSNGHDLTYEWDFDNGETVTGETVTHSYSTIGTYEVTLTVTDPEGDVDTDSVTVEVQNRPPTVDAQVSPTEGTIDDTYSFDASGSSDPEGHDITYEWDFDDGATATGETPTHEYAEPGTYTVTITATDSEGDATTDTIEVLVENRAPTATLDADKQTITVGESVQFDGGNSMDPDGQDVTHDWDFGDGEIATGEAVTHTYDSSGQYTAELTVTDTDGASHTDDVLITVENAPPEPTMTASPPEAETGDTIQFDASDSTDPDGHDLTYEWNFDDGTTKEGAVVTHEYSEAGDYEVMVTVSDGDKAQTASQDITVTPTTLVEDSFESGAYASHWSVMSGAWGVSDTYPAADGSHVLHSDSQSVNTIETINQDIPHDAAITLSGYVEAGTDNTVEIDFAYTNGNNYYRVTYAPADNSDPELSLKKVHDGDGQRESETLDSVTPTATNAGTRVQFDIDRTPDGEMTITAFAPDTGEELTVSATDLAHTDSGSVRLSEGGDAQTRYDDVLILDD